MEKILIVSQTSRIRHISGVNISCYRFRENFFDQASLGFCQKKIKNRYASASSLRGIWTATKQIPFGIIQRKIFPVISFRIIDIQAFRLRIVAFYYSRVMLLNIYKQQDVLLNFCSFAIRIPPTPRPKRTTKPLSIVMDELEKNGNDTNQSNTRK